LYQEIDVKKKLKNILFNQSISIVHINNKSTTMSATQLYLDIECNGSLIKNLQQRDLLFNPPGTNLNCCIFTLIRFIEDIIDAQNESKGETSISGDILKNVDFLKQNVDFLKQNAMGNYDQSIFLRNMLGIEHMRMIDVREVPSLWKNMLNFVFNKNYDYPYGWQNVHIIAKAGNKYQYNMRMNKLNATGYVLILQNSHYYSWVENGIAKTVKNIKDFISEVNDNVGMNLTLPDYSSEKLKPVDFLLNL